MYNLLKIFLLLEPLLEILHPALPEYYIRVYRQYLTHGHFVLLHGPFFTEKRLERRLPLSLKVRVALEARPHHVLELLKHRHHLLNQLCLREDLLDLSVFLVLLLREVHTGDYLLALHEDMVAEGLSDGLEVLLLGLIVIEGVEKSQVVEKVMLE